VSKGAPDQIPSSQTPSDDIQRQRSEKWWPNRRPTFLTPIINPDYELLDNFAPGAGSSLVEQPQLGPTIAGSFVSNREGKHSSAEWENHIKNKQFCAFWSF
jgi:hypothetical protein